MSAGDGLSDADVVDQVMNQVLAAERQARDAVEQCRAQAAAILAEAEERARAIGRRTEHRIRLTHKIADQAVDDALVELRGPDSGRTAVEDAGEARERVDRAVDALVEEILGGKA